MADMGDARSVMSDTATLVDRPEPPTQSPLLPGHSTCASRLSYETSQGKYSLLEYMALTFSVMVSCNNQHGPLVVAIDEDFSTLNLDIQRAFPRWNNQLRTRDVSGNWIKELNINWGSDGYGHKDHKEHKVTLRKENMVAMMRLLKSRNGQDVIVGRTV